MEWLKEQREMIHEVLNACKEKLTSDPNNMELVELRGVLYNWACSFDDAIHDLNKVINSTPENEDAYFIRSDCHFNKGEFDLAKQDYLRAMKLQFPEDKEFVEGYTEEVISTSTIANDEELANIKKVLDYEKKRILLSYIPELSED